MGNSSLGYEQFRGGHTFELVFCWRFQGFCWCTISSLSWSDQDHQLPLCILVVFIPHTLSISASISSYFESYSVIWIDVFIVWRQNFTIIIVAVVQHHWPKRCPWPGQLLPLTASNNWFLRVPRESSPDSLEGQNVSPTEQSWITSSQMVVSSFTMCLSNISDTAPNAPNKTGTTVTSFCFHNFLISCQRSRYFSILLLLLLLLLFKAGKLLALWERVVA